MSWLDKRVSFYKNHSDIIGRAATYREILLSHTDVDFRIITTLRKLNPDDPNYKLNKMKLKSKLKAFAPSALLQSRATGNIIEINRTGIMQLDFDEPEIQDYDIEELKQALFALPFIAFCSLSCSGKGFFALALIAEPERMRDYAEHCHWVLTQFGIKPDVSKGKNANDLRYISTDNYALIRENPEPLKITHFRLREAAKSIKQGNYSPRTFGDTDRWIYNGIEEILNVQPGSRWATVQRVSFTFGGLNNDNLLNVIHQAIESNGSFAGEVEKYSKYAEVCFHAGAQKPL